MEFLSSLVLYIAILVNYLILCDPPALLVEVMNEVKYNFNKVPTLQWGFLMMIFQKMHMQELH